MALNHEGKGNPGQFGSGRKPKGGKGSPSGAGLALPLPELVTTRRLDHAVGQGGMTHPQAKALGLKGFRKLGI